MELVKKISIVIVALFIITTIFSNAVNAIDIVVESSVLIAGSPAVSDTSGGNFDLKAFDTPPEKGVNETNKIVNQAAASVIGIARIVCVTIAIVMLLVIAMKYMISAPGDRADIKKHAVNYVIGAFVLFGITGILTVINNFAQSIGG